MRPRLNDAGARGLNLGTQDNQVEHGQGDSETAQGEVTASLGPQSRA